MKRLFMNSSVCSLILAVLSEDLLLKILDKFEEQSDLKNWRLVCKEFLRVEAIHKKTLRVYRHESLPCLLARYKDIQVLDLSVCPRIDDHTVTLIFRFELNRNLRKLVLRRATGLRSVSLELLVKSFPCLEEIDLSYCWRFGDREAYALSNAKCLRDLKLVKCLDVTDVGLAAIAVGCVKLEKLNLKWCMEITDLGIELLSKKCTNLKSLDISYLKVTNRSLDSISALRKLESLSMVACSNIDDEGLHFLKNANAALQSIDISRCDSVTSSGLTTVAKAHNTLEQISASYCFSELPTTFLSNLMELKSLRMLKLDGARVSSLNLLAIGNNCTNLVEVGLGKCAGVTDEGIMELVSRHGNLSSLDLTCCSLITDAALTSIAKYCKKLTCIKLESCDLITKKGLDQLGSSCSLLEEVDLTDCSGVDDDGLKSLSRCSELLRLKLGLCLNISDKGVSYIGSSCAKLQELDLYRCMGITDAGLLAICSGCKKLKKLNLCYCEQITDMGLKSVSTLEELFDLEMRRLTHITSAGLVAIAAGCKSLVELDMKRCYNINDTGVWALAQLSPNLRQINLSYCSVSDMGLMAVMGNMKCLQDAKLVHLTRVSVKGFELALRASCDRMKKLKLLNSFKSLLSTELLQMLPARGCKIRWVGKAYVIV
ncbi:hypothetical protein ACHQM5_026442 [Ranunculus cassubicifolius]